MNHPPSSWRTALCAIALLSTTATAQQQSGSGPWTQAERSGFTETSRLAEVQNFLDQLTALPGASDFVVSTFGSSTAGRPLLLVELGDQQPDEQSPSQEDPLRVLILANIHGGEVCGKEAVQILLREFARGEHAALRAGVRIWIAPIYNVDGNEAVATSNRSNVNGPVGGLGERTNPDGLDLNRDLLKAQAAETRALLGLLNRIDPHVFFDLHTTNGAPHAFHLTYAPGLSPNSDPAIASYLLDQHLPTVREAMWQRHAYRVFEYGNFPRADAAEYQTFDGRPRFATNYVGLRNRLSILSEAYAYEPFEIRVRATRAFLLENLQLLQRDRARIKALCAAADERCAAAAIEFPLRTELAPGHDGIIPTRGWDRMPLGEGRQVRVMRRSEVEERPCTIRTRFQAVETINLPALGWCLSDQMPDAALRALRDHGVEMHRLDEALQVTVQRFTPTSGDRAQRPYQGVRMVTLRGDWRDPETAVLPAGTWLVPSRQRLARVAAQLLEPESEDSLTTWGLMVDATRLATAAERGSFAVARVLAREP